MATTRSKAGTTAGKNDSTAVVSESAVSDKITEKNIVKEIDPYQTVTVYNGFHGKLIYKNQRTGEKYYWDEFGDEQEMELRELKNAKNSSKAFFENNWFMFGDDGQWVIDYLGVGAYYKFALKLNQFDDVFQKSSDEIRNIVSGMSSGQKDSLAYRARQLVADGTIDSRKVITALEESLGIELIEK